MHLIKYYRGTTVISQFIGHDETMALAIFNMKAYSFLPEDFLLTKYTAEMKEYVLELVPGGYSWVEVELNNPLKVLNNG